MRPLVPAFTLVLSSSLISTTASAGVAMTFGQQTESNVGAWDHGVAVDTDAPGLTDVDEGPVDEGPVAEGPLAEDEDAWVDETGDDPTGGLASEAPTMSDEPDAFSPGGYNAHALGFRTGLTIVPTAFLSMFLASHTNAQCRSTIGSVGMEKGNMRNDGCNWYIAGEYTYRKSRAFDIVGTAGYQRAKLPDGLWLDNDEWGDGCKQHDPEGVLPINNGAKCDLGAADYTEIDMGFVFIEADFIGRGTIVRTPDIEVQIGGGGGLGLGIVVGKGIHQTPIGYQRTGNADVQRGPGPACTSLRNLSDLTMCTPQYWDDPDIDQNGDGSDADGPVPPGGWPSELGGSPYFARCSKTECNKSDLNSFGSRIKQSDVPPVIPIINLIVTSRIIIKDTLGINIQGGWNTGFYFGGGLSYFFGGGGK